MAQLWGGRFTKQTSSITKELGDSIYFDKALWKEDITGSIAHAKMLGRQGILTKEESDHIVAGLASIYNDLDAGKLAISNDCEDIHSFVEATLIDRIGDDGKRLHTGRSRNDQVALDMKLYTRGAIDDVAREVLLLEDTILDLMDKNRDTFMPGFTHLQKAQPVTLAHHFGAYFEMFKRDFSRLADCRARENYCPLGSGALAGTTYPLDRDFVAKELHFTAPTANSMDSVSDRDFLLEFLSDLSILMMHLSRLSEEICIWNTNEYRYVELDDAFSTGSSIMPQKKNPDFAELTRGKTGRVYGDLMALLTVMKGLPLAYDKDLQEDKEPVFDAVKTAKGCLEMMRGMLSTATFRRDVMERSAKHGFTNATDAADYLVNKGVPFRDAHGIVGQLVLYCIDNGKALDDLSLEEFHRFSDVFDSDIYDAISLKTCVEKRLTKGAPGEKAMEEEIAQSRAWLREAEKSLPVQA
ncbi:MAG: argininosuccinate lyase [Lachnospiraceae bacterium]|jgi:argininosuccinate lyase|nr:argininosuccinate lyase [Lachnospiraceae bacterium]MCI1398164.1 argininosuccinate lyase [Lachnospiraceae bacterium]MCI1424063.1 argininosuccinate lyase [Lachnospiraceae bacterium]MCI1452910.1 argininosuccinate lyase [Lachnospiraceae bacterium]